MAEILSPGVFIEEVPAQVQVTQPVSTSNMGIVGFTVRGPSDQATLVTSYEQFQRIFGGLTKKSLMGLSMAAFFQNGGRRAFVVRVAPSDAVSAGVNVRSTRTDFELVANAGNGTLTTLDSATTNPNFDVGTGGVRPVVASTATVRWRGAGTPVVTQVLRNRGDTANLVGTGALAYFEGRIAPASLPAFDNALHAVVPGTVTVQWNDGGAKTLALSSPAAGSFESVTTNANGTQIAFDYRSGRISLDFQGSVPEIPANAQNITISYTPATATMSATDNGAGAFTSANLTASSIAYTTGEWSLSFVNTAGQRPHASARVVATYTSRAWVLDPVSPGLWGNDLRLVFSGHVDSYTPSTASYSSFDLLVQIRNPDSGVYETFETYEELVFTDPTSPNYFADVLNELSDLVSVDEPGGDLDLHNLNGVARSLVLAGGDEQSGSRAITATLPNAPLAFRSLTLTYTDTTGTVRTVTDDGNGRLTGSVDTAGTNTIDYTTGALNVTLLNNVEAGTLVTVVYRSVAAATTHVEAFGDTTKSYTVGSDGTFTTLTYGRSQISEFTTLSSAFKGIYALNRVEELMQVIVPDFAGDVTITTDLIDYCESRAEQASGGDRFLIMVPPKGSDSQEAVDWLRYQLARNSKYAACYWPWVKVADPLSNNRPLVMPPLGHIAGIYARTDARRNVGKSPGGTVDGALRFLTGLERDPTLGERDFVYPNRINPLVSGPQTGLAVWGVRTIAAESEWRYINARRLFMFLEKSIFNATHWIVFENNGPALWARIKAQVNGFLTALFNEGYFAGGSPAQAFFVICDESNNTAASINLGQVVIDVGVAPNKPAEFVRFRFTQKAQE